MAARQCRELVKTVPPRTRETHAACLDQTIQLLKVVAFYSAHKLVQRNYTDVRPRTSRRRFHPKCFQEQSDGFPDVLRPRENS